MADPAENKDKKPVVFNHAEAVAAARRDYPEETKNVTFIDLAAPDAREKLQQWIWATSTIFQQCARELASLRRDPEKFQEKRLLAMKLLNNEVDRRIKKMAFCEQGDIGEQWVHAMHCELSEDQASDEAAVFNSEAGSLWYSFDHELGHVVVPNGHAQQANKNTDQKQKLASENKHEHAADGFGIIRGLKRGTLSIEEASRFSYNRTLHMGRDPAHWTTRMIDRILAIAETTGGFSNLSYPEVKDMAQNFADTHAVSSAQLTFLQTEFKSCHGKRGTSTQAQAEKLARLCMIAQPNSLSFYLCARLLSTVLNGCLKSPDRAQAIGITGQKWDDVRLALASRVPGAGAGRLRIDLPGK